jgi:hypothetical protein
VQVSYLGPVSRNVVLCELLTAGPMTVESGFSFTLHFAPR